MSERRHVHLQPLGGIAGDMFVAAMLDAFPHLAAQVLNDVAAVLPKGLGEARLERVSRNGIAAAHFFLDAAGAPSPAPDPSSRAAAESAHGATHAQHHHHDAAANHVHDGHAPHGEPHRHGHEHGSGNYAALRGLIEHSTLPRSTARHALGILRVIAEAESAIHGVPLDDVHFHEIADWDSVMDVVAAGSVISGVGDVEWSVDALPLGSGGVRTQHGFLPVPSPATSSILQGYRWHSDGVEGERVTPTGAAIVRYLVSPASSNAEPQGVLSTSGYGAGTRNLPGLANVLRVLAFERSAHGRSREDRVAVVQFDVDDMTGEEIGLAADRLRGEPGVLDVVLVPGLGKKGRPVTLFQVLALPDALERCGNAIFLETSTIGLRWMLCDRRILPRSVDRPGDDGMRVKEVQRPNGTTTRKVESDDLDAVGGLHARRAMKSKHEGR
jgi:uncharacterized protein (TIGR00299 family) protein